MTSQSLQSADLLAMVHAEAGTVERTIFSDQEIYELELERIFARAWNFMAHESQISSPGDFFQTYIGEDRAIVVRDKEGGVQVLLNTCRHRGNAVCRAEEGHATSFMCTYHGWTYDLKGALVGVPGFKDYYHEDLNREEWGLVRAAHVDSYKGFVFATLDPDAPSLDEFLGDVGRISIDLIAERGNDMRVINGIQKYTIGCNWKLAVDNIWDYYHGQISHASSRMARWNMTGPVGSPGNSATNRQVQEHLVILGDYGHAIGGPAWNGDLTDTLFIDEAWRDRPSAKRDMGAVGIRTRGHPNIFPNMWITESGQVSMRMPKGPLATEIWWFSLVDMELPPEKYESFVHRSNHVFGPAGMLEQEDGENWDQSTRGTVGTVAKRYPLHYAMNLGRGEVVEDESGPPRIDTHINEHAQLWHYRAWADWMSAESWAELRANHTPSPSGYV